MIFTVRQLQDKCQEQNVDIFMTSVDLTKESKFGYPAHFIANVLQFRDGMLARVQNDGEYSKPFSITNRLTQGCVLAPTLFNMMSQMHFRIVMMFFSIRYHFDGKLFDLRRLQAKSKVQTDNGRWDSLCWCHGKECLNRQKMQEAMDPVSQACDNYDLQISTYDM